MKTLLIIAAGGALGAATRHVVAHTVGLWTGQGFPWGILIVNVVGCLAMGILAGVFAHLWAVPADWRLFLTTGFLGGFTTFSAFALDIVLLLDRGRMAQAAAYMGLSVGMSVLALILGLMLARLLDPLST